MQTGNPGEQGRKGKMKKSSIKSKEVRVKRDEGSAEEFVLGEVRVELASL